MSSHQITIVQFVHSVTAQRFVGSHSEVGVEVAPERAEEIECRRYTGIIEGAPRRLLTCGITPFSLLWDAQAPWLGYHHP